MLPAHAEDDSLDVARRVEERSSNHVPFGFLAREILELERIGIMGHAGASHLIDHGPIEASAEFRHLDARREDVVVPLAKLQDHGGVESAWFDQRAGTRLKELARSRRAALQVPE
ncbi:MAG: hypothetical protein R3B96_08080 [Pirellulaceae bacterium]